MKKCLSIVLGVIISMILMGTVTVNAKDAQGNVIIVLDPGHSATDGGAVNSKTGLTETEVVWEIADSLKTELETYDGIKVYLTRTKDGNYYQSGWLTGRSYVVRDGIDGKVDFFISLHMNSSTAADEPYVAGSYVYASVHKDHKTASTDLANRIINNLKNDIGIINKPKGASYKHSTIAEGYDYYTVMENCTFWGVTPILIEHCFINKADEVLFVSDGGKHVNKEKINKIALSEANAIVDYFNLEKRVVEATEAGNNSVTLEKSYGFLVKTKKELATNPNYTSSNTSVAVVDANGKVTAVGSGSAEISVKFADGTTGKCTVNVNEPTIIKIAAQYEKYYLTYLSQLKSFDLNSKLRVKAVYSDGTVKEVTPTHVSMNPWVEGINEVRVIYNDYITNVRVHYKPANWVQGTLVNSETELPTGAQDTWQEPTSEPETKVEPTKEQSPTLKASDTGNVKKKDNNQFLKVIIILFVILLVLAIILLVLKYIQVVQQRNRRRRRRR